MEGQAKNVEKVVDEIAVLSSPLQIMDKASSFLQDLSVFILKYLEFEANTCHETQHLRRYKH